MHFSTMGIHNAPKSLVIQPNHILPKEKQNTEQKPCFWNVEQQPQSGVEAFPISEIPKNYVADVPNIKTLHFTKLVQILI